MASEITPLNATAARSAYDIGDLEASKVRFVRFQKNYGPDGQTHELPSSESQKGASAEQFPFRRVRTGAKSRDKLTSRPIAAFVVG